ncbi:hypothetical protein [Nonomuraea sp. B1E8]|uniref:hypothetical protein n=1 Tax=unclassified Nonomuraea TaxID=2593643 RepID=UPI00325F67B1
MPPATARYELYGLQSGNPYTCRPLNAVADDADRARLLELAGFVRLATIKEAVETGVSGNRPVFFLINGVSKSGRTSLANHVMSLYRDAAGLGESFATHCAEPEEMTQDPYPVMCSTLLSLRNKMNEQAIAIPEVLRERFTELGRRAHIDQMNAYDLQEIAGLTGSTFAAAKGGFGIRYESVPTKKLITLATQVFAHTRTVVVFTVDDYDHANTFRLTRAERERLAPHVCVVDLAALTGEQVAHLARDRWTGRPPSPFHEEGVKSAFSGRPYTIGRAMQHLELLLEFRLREYDKDDPWPTDDLHMPESWLVNRMYQRERWNGLGGIDG